MDSDTEADTTKALPLTARNIERTLGPASTTDNTHITEWETRTTDTTKIDTRRYIAEFLEKEPEYNSKDITRIGEAAWQQMKREGRHNLRTHEIIIQYDPEDAALRSYFKRKRTGLSRADYASIVPIWNGITYTPKEIEDKWRRQEQIRAEEKRRRTEEARRRAENANCCCSVQ